MNIRKNRHSARNLGATAAAMGLALVLGAGTEAAAAKIKITVNRDRAKRALRAVWKGTTYMRTERNGVIEIMRRRLPDLPAEGLIRDVDVEEVQRELSGANWKPSR